MNENTLLVLPWRDAGHKLAVASPYSAAERLIQKWRKAGMIESRDRAWFKIERKEG